MKILLRPSDIKRNHAAPIVAITTNHDEHTILEVLELLITPALVGYGFHPQLIQDAFREFAVPGAEVVELPSPAGPDEYNTPEDFVFVGWAGVDGDFSEDDVLFTVDEGHRWTETRWINGGDREVAYAVREGSDAHKAVLAAL